MTDIEEHPQTAMLLTDTEWQDLAFMLAIYKGVRIPVLGDFQPEVQDAIRRRLALADRIIEAAKG
jgi:hypothetical protein